MHTSDVLGQKRKQSGSPDPEEPQLISPRLWGSGPTSLLFPSQAERFPKEPGNSSRMCVTPGGSETKAEQGKKLPFLCPSPKGIHSEQPRVLLKWRFLSLGEGTVCKFSEAPTKEESWD